GSAKNPLVQRYIARRIAEPAESKSLAALVALMSKGDDTLRRSVLGGVYEALQGRRRVAEPPGWSELYPQLSQSRIAETRQHAVLLALIFGDVQALTQLRTAAADAKTSVESRQQAIAAMAQAKSPDLAPLLQRLLGDPQVRVAALRGLAACNEDSTPSAILKR